eukprot:TRINITY_DN16768_c0_g2_i2.p1 TRINITY_DN16768_c0_g2~~TRINITY_DN16768_c0_g2_i2.p1  ORF type:complete len:830 (+),score=100.44 TRINITY_DN16768_c0_g2_i2:27-2492(+)
MRALNSSLSDVRFAFGAAVAILITRAYVAASSVGSDRRQGVRIAAEEPGTVGTTPQKTEEAGCAHSRLWEVFPSDFADALAAKGFVSMHVAPCLCVDDAGIGDHQGDLDLLEARGTDALRPCLPEHHWFFRGGSRFQAQARAEDAASLAASQPEVAAVLAPALLCAGLLSVITRVFATPRRIEDGSAVEAELASAASNGLLRKNGDLGLAKGGVAGALRRLAAAPDSKWDSCPLEALAVLGVLHCWPRRHASASSRKLTQSPACVSMFSDVAPSLEAVDASVQRWNDTGSSGKSGGAQKLVAAAIVAATQQRAQRQNAKATATHIAVASQLEICPGASQSETFGIVRHLNVGGTSGNAVAHVLAASVVPADDAETGLALEVLLYVDGGASGGVRCLAAFSVGACRSLPRFPLLDWRCTFSEESFSRGAAASHYGTEVVLRCPLPAGAARRLSLPRALPSRQPVMEVMFSAEGEASWGTSVPLKLCLRQERRLSYSWRWGGSLAGAWGRSQWGVVGCSAPMWLAQPEKHGDLVRQWLAYHQLIGFDRFVVYDLDGSLAEAVEPFVQNGFVEYIDRWPERLSPGACGALLSATEPATGATANPRDEAARYYCTQTQAEAHCVWNMRGRADWAMLLHSFDAYAGAGDGFRHGVRPLLKRLEPLRAEAAVLAVQRLDFGGQATSADAVVSRFVWRQRAPLILRGRIRGALDTQTGAQAHDHPGAVLVNPWNTWSLLTHWGRGRPGTIHLTLSSDVLRLNHYVDILGESRCARAAAEGDPPCNVFDNASAWTGRRILSGLPRRTPRRRRRRGTKSTTARPRMLYGV